VAPRYVQRLFEGASTTFSEYVLSERLARVHMMLTNPYHARRTVGAIALEASFGDISYFNRRFRRHYGMRGSVQFLSVWAERRPDRAQAVIMFCC
jgi:AraC-like DNA-binding protein